MHGEPGEPVSDWVDRFAALVPPSGVVLDVACGRGRHARFFLERGHRVVAIDRDLEGVADLDGNPGVELIEADLEAGGPFPPGDRMFAGVVVTRYLYRPRLPDLVAAVAPGGVLLYETFARGHELHGRPSRPEFLLDRGELLDAVRGSLDVVAYEDLTVDGPARVQRIAAVRAATGDVTGADRRRAPYVAVIGPSDATDSELARAETIGRMLGARGAVLVCGGLDGVMEAASRGAFLAGGTVVGLLPGSVRSAANPYVHVAVTTGLGEMRNALIVRAVDAVVAIGGAYGTLSEVAFALRTGIPVVGLDTWDLADVIVVADEQEAVDLALALATEVREQRSG